MGFITQKYQRWLDSQRKTYPVSSNRASELGHPCLRYLYLLRTNWKDRGLPSLGLQAIFEEGKDGEEIVMRRLRESGLRIVQQQRPFRWEVYDINGSIDGMIEMDDGRTYPFEVKTINGFDYDKIRTLEDIAQSPKVWMRKIPVQLALYMLMGEPPRERGILLFKNKGFMGEREGSGDSEDLDLGLKEIEMNLDQALKYGEIGLKNAEQVNECLKEGRTPGPLPDPAYCMRCPFSTSCEKELSGHGILSFSNDTELLQALEDYHELESQLEAVEASRLEGEKKKLGDKIKKMVEGKPLISIGRFKVSGEWRERKGYEVKPSRSWAWDYEPIPLPKGGEGQ